MPLPGCLDEEAALHRHEMGARHLDHKANGNGQFEQKGKKCVQGDQCVADAVENVSLSFN